MCKGGNLNTLKLKIKPIHGIILEFCVQLSIQVQFCFRLVHNQFRLFYGKIVTSLADFFTMEKALFKIIVWHKTYIC